MLYTAWRFYSVVATIPIWWYIANLVIDRVGTLVILILLFVLGIKKQDGLWSTETEWEDAHHGEQGLGNSEHTSQTMESKQEPIQP
jgi:hypothetical protein